MAFTSFVGIDRSRPAVSKLTIDAATVARPCTYPPANLRFIAPATRQQFENRPSGFRKLLAWVHQHGDPTSLLFCLEHTATADRGNICSSPVLLF